MYVLADTGYALARAGSIGVTCLVERETLYAIEPTCYYAEGAASTMQVAFERERLRARNVDEARIAALVADGYRLGRFRPPGRPGVAYMLSPNAAEHDPESGTTEPIPPHLMFYAPFLTDADVGGQPGTSVYVHNPGRPTAYMVVFMP